ncbi:dTDP-4-dehydrorhamnose reductase [Microbulbifer agarilyticus]|uniref:dTDP-4-dehydrorhamnose reductase n=1 Tax=Microbulbifer agarilyticus TaxID=260552 RepID=UPI001CD46339|nr:dTDP-4-dehydrorhamnose reductase [Microbulbifer agarilyticus]MCA0901403.1 dTDP-4-dehydrorhamnose reductase [Microbulbifer agarilyticus]
MIRVLISGANGQLGQELTSASPNGYEVISLSRADLDITNAESVSNALSKFSPHVVINAAAYTKVDLAETERESCHAANADAPGYLAEACHKTDAALIHVSTDFVFDGCSSRPYTVDSKTSPQSEYGRSKLLGENRIISSGLENYAIIRTSWVYSSYGSNFVKTMLRLMASRDRLAVVGDQVGTPTSASRLASIIWQLVDKFKTGEAVRLNMEDRIFHWSDAGVASWYDFAVAVQREALDRGLLSRQIEVDCIPSEAYPTPAHRPHYSVMDTSKLRSLLAIGASHWSCELSKVLDVIKEDKTRREVGLDV